MIVTLTANPSLDRTVTLESPLIVGGVNRIVADVTQPGGKGVNVSLGLRRAGLSTLAVLPAAPDEPLLALLDSIDVPYRAVPISARARTNLAVLAGGETTKINEPGIPVSPEQVSALENTLAEVVSRGDSVMLSGSLAPGFPVDEYARLVRMMRPLGVWVGVDTSDAPLRSLGSQLPLAAPDFLKPNGLELGQLTGRDGLLLEEEASRGDLTGAVQATRDLVALGVGAVLVTLGGAGAILADEGGLWYAPSPPVEVVSTVGAGDSATAGYLVARARGLKPPERLAYAVAYGATAVSLPGTTIPTASQVQPDIDAVVAV